MKSKRKSPPKSKRIKNEPPTADEISRAVTGIEAGTIFGLQTVRGKADQINAYATFINKPDYFQADLDRYRKVTPADIQRVAKTYLTDKRLVMTIVPRTEKAKPAAEKPTPKKDVAEKTPEKTPEKKSETAKDGEDFRNTQPAPGETPKFTLPKIEESETFKWLGCLARPAGRIADYLDEYGF